MDQESEKSGQEEYFFKQFEDISTYITTHLGWERSFHKL